VTVGSNAFRDKLGYWMDRVAAGEEVIITRRGRPRFRMLPINGESPPAPDDSTDMARSRGGEWSRHRTSHERPGVVASGA
jgi:prevent-host-death family protein